MKNLVSKLDWRFFSGMWCRRSSDPTSTGRGIVFVGLIFAVITASTPLLAQQFQEQISGPVISVLEPASQPKTSGSESADAGRNVDELLTRLVLENMPHNFDEIKDWGGQSERWDGVKVRREGLKIKTHSRKKLVNHGTWKKYSAQLRNPEEEFTVQVKNMRETADQKLAFDIHFLAHLNIEGRQSKWVKGVQLYSISAKGHSKVRLVVSIELEVKMGVLKLPPDIVFVPVATNADLIVDEFRIDRISKAGGEFSQQVTKGVRSKLDEKIDEKKTKLLEKINKQLADKSDELRISIADAVKSKWTGTTKAFLPKSVQQAIDE